MHPIWLCVFSCRRFEESFEKAQWSKVVQMQPLWLCILLCTRFENTFEETRKKSNKCDQCDYISCYASHLRTHLKTQWKKVVQMQPMWLCILSGRQFEDTFEITQWRKAKQMQPMWLCIFLGRHSKDSFENTQRRKIKQMQPIWPFHSQKQAIWGDIWKHIAEKSQTNAISVTMPLLR